VKPLHYFGMELVLWRGEDGKARMLDAYCRHLGAHLGHGGKVRGNAIECPFHAWRYDETGAVIEIPYARVIPPQVAKPCVGSWPMVEKNKLIWAWYHPHGDAPHWDVEETPDCGAAGWTSFERHEWTVRVQLQDMAENAADSAHFRYVHGTAEFPDMESTFDGHRRAGVVRSRLDTPKGPIDGQIANCNIGPGQAWVRFSGISETLLVSGVTPIEHDLVHVRFAFSQPETQRQGPMSRLADALIRDLVKQFEQDKVVWEHKRYEADPILCDGDGPIALFRRYYSQFYAEHGDVVRPLEKKIQSSTASQTARIRQSGRA
jgi:3-ketosteroid 9alpha-monooxygenase subunit A